MKYASLIIFAVALAWTWNIVHNTSSISFETHSGIQERLAEFITETVKAKRPTVSEVLIEKVWTEAIANNKVKAFFVYSFKDNSESGPVASQIHGEGILQRQPKTDESDANDHWTLTEIRTNSDMIEFADATIVTGSPNGSPDLPTETPALEAPTEGHQLTEPQTPPKPADH